jgi:hypothetical protein
MVLAHLAFKHFKYLFLWLFNIIVKLTLFAVQLHRITITGGVRYRHKVFFYYANMQPVVFDISNTLLLTFYA